MTHADIALPNGASQYEAIRDLFGHMPRASDEAIAAVRARQARLTKPAGALGRLEEIVEFLAAWQAKPLPTIDRPLVAVFAGNHGVAAKGVSAYPASVTHAMVANFAAGGAAINQICSTYNIGLEVFELALDQPTKDMTETAALEIEEAATMFASGRKAIERRPDLLCIGEMGIANTTVAAAIYHALYGGAAADWVGRGTGLDEAGLGRKIAAVETAVGLHGRFLDDPLEAMRRVGGREIAAMAGAILAARLERIPVVLDGYVVCAAAAVLHALDETALDHCLAAHLSEEGAHAEVLRRLGKRPLLDFGMRLGEGSGAALAAGLIRAAVACHRDMATFAEAEVEGPIANDTAG